jgi:hypothetical protein
MIICFFFTQNLFAPKEYQAALLEKIVSDELNKI